MKAVHSAVACLLLLYIGGGEGKVKTYYLAIQEIIWDYAPSGLNLITNNRLKDEPISRIYSDMFIGKKYKKAVYRRYTDDTYQTPVPHDPNLGFMGPTLRAEVGDTILLHLFNNATRVYSAHPHGVFYTKLNEGALYQDNSTGSKYDDKVPPGGKFTYVWEVLPEFGPTKDDPNCMTWAYHSHTSSPEDVNSGLVGALIVCRPGTYREDESRKDVDHEFVAMFFIPYEIESWYFWENLRVIPNWRDVDIKGKLFDKGNKMHVVNGNMYGNTPGYDVCQGDTISWHVLGMGSNRDLHPIQFQGQTVKKQHHRRDSMIAIPATFSTLLMTANNPGRWLVACKLYSHFTEGMTAWLTVNPTCKNPNVPLPSASLTGKIREYFVAAEEILWNYGPSGFDLLKNISLTQQSSASSKYFVRNSQRMGGVYEKAVFRGYTDDTFSNSTPRPSDLGILGPVIAGEVGDTIKVVFKNTAKHHAFNMEPHGVYYQESYAAPPGAERTYTWTLPDDVAPTKEDPNCLVSLYTSTVSYVADSNSGLVGPLLVCKRGTLEEELRKPQKYILLTVFDENKSWYFQNNMKRLFTNPDSVNVKNSGFVNSNLMHSINGLMFGNLQLDLCFDKNTSLHLISVGTKLDIHGFTMEGVNFRKESVNVGALNLFAHVSITVSMKPEYVGSGRVLCRTIDHLMSGMTASYRSKLCSCEANCTAAPTAQTPPIARTYYIAAEEVIWDYNKREVNAKGESVNLPGNFGYTHEHNVPGRLIGSKYKKVLYYEYTDDTFTTKKQKPVHLGILGPVIRGAVGEAISVFFWNNASRPYNMYPWGAVDQTDNVIQPRPVQPGNKTTYTWLIPESASPKPNQPACQSFIYSSSVDPAIDPIDGLMGPLLVCKRGSFNSTSQGPVGADKEFFLQFFIVNENLGHYIDKNIQYFMGVDPSSVKRSGAFIESNKMKAINGFLSHVDGLVMEKGDLVRWYLIGWGNLKDYHSIHFHSNTFVHVFEGAHRGDVFDVYPGTLGTVEMRVIEVGEWLLHCHVFEHIHGGMETVYTVVEKNSSTVKSSSSKSMCVIRRHNNVTEYDCSGMDIEKLEDFVNRRRYIAAKWENGTKPLIETTKVEVLNLNQNRLSTRGARRIFRFFPNLKKLSLDHNSLTVVPAFYFRRNRNLRWISVQHNPRLMHVSKTMVNRSPSTSNFAVVDLSSNMQLKPPCLNQRFTSMKIFVECYFSNNLP